MIEGKINSKKKTGPLILIKDKYSKELVLFNLCVNTNITKEIMKEIKESLKIE